MFSMVFLFFTFFAKLAASFNYIYFFIISSDHNGAAAELLAAGGGRTKSSRGGVRARRSRAEIGYPVLIFISPST